MIYIHTISTLTGVCGKAMGILVLCKESTLIAFCDCILIMQMCSLFTERDHTIRNARLQVTSKTRIVMVGWLVFMKPKCKLIQACSSCNLPTRVAAPRNILDCIKLLLAPFKVLLGPKLIYRSVCN